MPACDQFNPEAIRLDPAATVTNTLEEREAAALHVTNRADIPAAERDLILRMLGLDEHTKETP